MSVKSESCRRKEGEGRISRCSEWRKVRTEQDMHRGTMCVCVRVCACACVCVCVCVTHIGEAVFIGVLVINRMDGESSFLTDLPVMFPSYVHKQVLVQKHKRSHNKEHPQLTKQTDNKEDLEGVTVWVVIVWGVTVGGHSVGHDSVSGDSVSGDSVSVVSGDDCEW